MSKLKIFSQTLALFKKIVFLQHDIEAIHNKDYSVVKTSKTEQSNLLRFFISSSHKIAQQYQPPSRQKPQY